MRFYTFFCFSAVKDTGFILVLILVDFLFSFWPFRLLLCVVHCIDEHMASLGGIEGWVPFNSL